MFFLLHGFLALFVWHPCTRDTCYVGRMGPRLSFLVYVNALRPPPPIQRGVWVVFGPAPALCFMVHGVLTLVLWRICTRDTFTGCCVGRMGPLCSFSGLCEHIALTLNHPARV